MNAKFSLLPCDACGEGNLHPKIACDAVEYKSHHGKIRRHYSVCDVCGSELADAQQMLENRRELVRFKKQVDNVPLGEEIAQMRKRLNLSQAQAGKLFGGGPVAFCKYEHDDILPDEAMSNLLYLAINFEDTAPRLALRKSPSSLPYLLHANFAAKWHKETEKFDLNLAFWKGHEMALEVINKHAKIAKKAADSVEKPVEMKLAVGHGWNGGASWTIQ
jgi:HTH-type transcriptional regulator / antitoxin MqsA